MPRQITIYVPPTDHAWLIVALQALADDVLTSDEAGQRGAKLSKLIHMLACAYVANSSGTARLMREIKELGVIRDESCFFE